MGRAEPAPVVLVIEDEKDIRGFVRTSLESEGWHVFEAGTVATGLVEAGTRKPDVVILDLGLPDRDGLLFIQEVRKWSELPILILSARTEEPNKIAALDAGADDYLTKPFGVRELMARVAAVTRRHARQSPEAETSSGVLVAEGLRLDPERRELTVRDELAELIKQEFDVLHLLMSKRGIVLSRAALLRGVWSGDTYVTERTVDAVVSRIRRKIERDPQDPELLLTAWGTGYKFVDKE